MTFQKLGGMSMSVLNKSEILNLCETRQLIDPYDRRNIKYSSYDLRVGEEYRLSSQSRVSGVSRNGSIEIPAHEICFILTEERITLPNDLCAFLFSRLEGMKRGYLMHPQPPIDPGYSGRLCILLHNLSNFTITLHRGQHIASIVFMKLSNAVENGYGFDQNDDRYQHGNNLRDFIDDATYTSALTQIADKLKKTVNNWRETLISKWMPLILTFVSILLIILTILLTILISKFFR